VIRKGSFTAESAEDAKAQKMRASPDLDPKTLPFLSVLALFAPLW